MFLMPSRYEPCGLGQLISLRYGTVPVVRWTGGLSDTVIEFDQAKRRGTGFGFSAYAPEALLTALRKALATYHDIGAWHQLVKRGMTADFSWEQSAREYVTLYKKAIKQASRK
jgi:starch synthase